MDIITYSIRDGEGHSDRFYREAAVLADKVTAYAEQTVMPAAKEFGGYIRKVQSQEVGSPEEYAFELLTLGVLWRAYGRQARLLDRRRARLLGRLAAARQGAGRLKPAVDRLRGLLGGLWLPAEAETAASAAPAGAARRQRHMLQPTLEHMERLLAWLSATGEFAQETARLRQWHGYLARLPVHAARSILQAALDFAAWFEPAAIDAFGRYTARVDRFRLEHGTSDRFREDAILRDRRMSEYHLNLVGAELMNRAYRKDFEGTERKAVLLPACLCARTGGNCAACQPKNGFHCAHCTPGCSVSRISAEGLRQGFEVLVAPHESDAFACHTVERLRREHTGIVGIACALNLIAGGWRAKSAGLPAQCVILDYCGCGTHWDDGGGFPTGLNEDRLYTILAPGRS